MPHSKAEDILNTRGATVIASVIEELGPLPVTIEHEAYYGRGPVLSVKAANEHGNFTSRDFDFRDDSELATIRLVNAIVSMVRDRFDAAGCPLTRCPDDQPEGPIQTRA